MERPQQPARERQLIPDRLPPHSIEAEQATLGCILLDYATVLPKCMEALREGGRVFYDLRHQTIYETCVELSEDGVPIDVISLQDRLRTWQKLEQVGGINYLSVLPDTTPSAENIDHYLQIIKERYVMRRMITTCTEVVGRIFDHEGDVDELMDTCERDVLQISESRIQVRTHSMNTLVHEVLNDIEHAVQNQGSPTGLTTGFQDLDRITGGLADGDMVLLAGRPSMGKSSLAMNIAEHVACQLHLGVGVISLEMTAKSMVNRMLASRARVNTRNIRDGFLAERDFPRLTGSAGTLAHAPIYIDDISGQSIMQIRAKLRRMWQQHDIKLGIIDYLQLANAIGGKRKFESRQQEVSEISVGVKNIAKELSIPIIALSQLNRELEREKSRKPRLADLRESGSLEQDSDIVGMLYKPQIDDDSSEHDEAIPVNLLIAKNRNGPTGDVQLTFLKSYTRFESAARVRDEDVPHQPQAALPYTEN